MNNSQWVLVIIFCAIPLGADTCLAPKNPVPATVVCGHVMDPIGETVADVELQLVSKGTIVAKVNTDADGNFMFGPLQMGEYDLTTKSDGWHLFWPVKITSSKPSKVCKKPLEVVLGIKVCGQSVSKKGYHAKF